MRIVREHERRRSQLCPRTRSWIVDFGERSIAVRTIRLAGDDDDSPTPQRGDGRVPAWRVHLASECPRPCRRIEEVRIFHADMARNVSSSDDQTAIGELTQSRAKHVRVAVLDGRERIRAGVPEPSVKPKSLPFIA